MPKSNVLVLLNLTHVIGNCLCKSCCDGRVVNASVQERS